MSNAATQVSGVHVLTKAELRAWDGGITASDPLADITAEQLAENELVRVWDIWERPYGTRYARDIYDAGRELEAALVRATKPLFPRRWDAVVKAYIAAAGLKTWLATRRASVQ
ncbi:hypothetical protein [Mycobacteroides abscessus]|nr:hypothetical protein [Mycobacteroides abscessus]SHQ50397.1 Uncharacterised protein [Mycobacteroides abscessus subsp. abscessus]SKQ83515.1 Uncharacterised protein [Mycobacteroides abscessus subsp. massiliense]SLC49927.1 Uncharacterised protein [Mycobacteroides abscessus subsp. massiliense]